MPLSPRGGPHGGGCGVARAGGEALLGRCLVRRARWPLCAAHVFTGSFPDGGMARPLRSLVGHGRRWWRGVVGAAGKRVVKVDADAAWASCACLQWLLLYVGCGRRRQSTEWRRGFVHLRRWRYDRWTGGGGAAFLLFSGVDPVRVKLGRVVPAS
jgi:hypothetical protein